MKRLCAAAMSAVLLISVLASCGYAADAPAVTTAAQAVTDAAEQVEETQAALPIET